jgi:hypothetical protein
VKFFSSSRNAPPITRFPAIAGFSGVFIFLANV